MMRGGMLLGAVLADGCPVAADSCPSVDGHAGSRGAAARHPRVLCHPQALGWGCSFAQRHSSSSALPFPCSLMFAHRWGGEKQEAAGLLEIM